MNSISPLVRFLALLAAALLLSACRGIDAPVSSDLGEVPPGIVAFIGAQPVSEVQWQQGRAYAEVTLRLLGEPGTELDEAAALESYVEDLSIVEEAAAAGFELPETVIIEEERQLLQVAGRSQEDLVELLAEVGLSFEGWRRELARAVVVSDYLEEVILVDVPPGTRGEARRRWLAERKEELGVQIVAEMEPVQGLGVGDRAPDFELATLGGETIQLSDFRGQAVLLNFWATWCFPCREEMPLFQQAYDEFQGDGLVILAVDVGEATAAVQEFAQEFGINFVIGLDWTAALSREYRVFGLPTSFFINREGVIDFVVPGAVRESDLDRHLKRILE